MNSGIKRDLKGVWGTSASNVFAAGFAGTILRYDGSTWERMTSNTTDDLDGVWGNSGTDIFAVGYTGSMVHYDGSDWSPMTSGVAEDLFDVWGSSGTDVFAVGRGGTVVHYDGLNWSAMQSGTTSDLYGVWGSSGNSVFAVGDGGTILLYGSDEQRCPVEMLYGTNSGETELLRDFRDQVLSKTPQGQRLIDLYYTWSPHVVKRMENDPQLQAEARRALDGVLPLIKALAR